jgi:hypothetical protein
VVRDEYQVGGQRLAASAEGVGQVSLQSAVEASLQLGVVGEGGEQGVVGGRVGGAIAEGGAGSGQREDTAGGITEDSPEGIGGAAGSVVGQAEILLQTDADVKVDVGGGECILPLSHGSLLV